MYASTWICTKVSADPTPPVVNEEGLESGHSEVVESLEL